MLSLISLSTYNLKVPAYVLMLHSAHYAWTQMESVVLKCIILESNTLDRLQGGVETLKGSQNEQYSLGTNSWNEL